MTDNQLADKVISGEFLALLLDLLFCWEEKTKNVKPDTRCIFRSSSRDGRNKEGGHLPLGSGIVRRLSWRWCPYWPPTDRTGHDRM